MCCCLGLWKLRIMSRAGCWGQLSQPPSWEVCAIKGGHALQKCIFIAAEGARLIFLCVLRLQRRNGWLWTTQTNSIFMLNSLLHYFSYLQMDPKKKYTTGRYKTDAEENNCFLTKSFMKKPTWNQTIFGFCSCNKLSLYFSYRWRLIEKCVWFLSVLL